MKKETQGEVILLTGATGYVGGRLLRALLEKRVRLRCLARNPDSLRGKIPNVVEVHRGDVLDPETLPSAMKGVDTAYYLIHSMGTRGSFEEADRIAAKNFVEAANRSGIRRLIYLGGLAHGDNLSSHLASRLEVGQILRNTELPTVEFRASIIIGLGSLSFEMVRALVHRLPLMITPKWVTRRAQPIHIDDVIDYLTAALDLETNRSEVYEIGGADRVSYLGIMKEYARQNGLRRFWIPVPVLTPRLSSYWLKLVTPLQARVGMDLIEGMRNESIVRDDRALATFSIRPVGIQEAIRKALSESP
jgi:uncharacterized protein YbjT (DUF2867 family)